ncbi:MAG: PAS domain-containing protein [Sandaracinaceae bacterium]
MSATADNDTTPDFDFRHFLTMSFDAHCIASPEGYFKWLNPRWTALLGWSEEELLSRPFVSFIHPDDVERTHREIASLSRGIPTVRFTNRYAHIDGSWRWLDWVTVPDPEAGLFYCTARDVTTEHEHQAMRARQVELLQLAERLAEVGHWRVDLKAQTVFWSPQVYRIHGRDPDVYSPNLTEGIEAYHPDDREAVSTVLGKTIEHGVPFDFEKRVIRTDGDVRTIRAHGRAELDASGHIVGVFGIFRDVTEERRAREELESFAYAASHDLQAPLRTMRGMLELLDDELPSDAGESRELLQRISRAGLRMQRRITGLLDVARAKKDGSTGPVPLGPLVASLSEQFAAQLSEEGAELHVADLPVVQGHEAQLTSVFQNLISNALRYRSERPPRIRIEAVEGHGLWRISVSDNGRGFEMQDPSRVFELFVRGEHMPADKASLNGEKPLGLGLSLCKRIVEMHRGTVGVSTTPGGGSTFWFTLPRADQIGPPKPSSS